MLRAARFAAVTAALAAAVIVGVRAQQRGAPRTILQSADISVPEREVVETVADFQPQSTTGWHTHPGEMVGYILEGTVVVEQEGKPSATFSAGQSFIIPAGKPHTATGGGRAAARMLATYIVERGKPLNTPVSAR